MMKKEKTTTPTITTNKRHVGGHFSLLPHSNTIAVWENEIREHLVWWGDAAIKIISTSLLISGPLRSLSDFSDLEANSTHSTLPTHPIHLKFHHPQESSYILPVLLGTSEPCVLVEPERENWWEATGDPVKVRVRVHNQNPVTDLANPESLERPVSQVSQVKEYHWSKGPEESEKSWKSEFYKFEAYLETHEIKKDLGSEEEDYCFRQMVVEGPILASLSNTSGYNEYGNKVVWENVEVNENEVREFIRSLLISEHCLHVQDTNHFLVLPEHIVYRTGEGAPLVVKGKYMPNPKTNQWAFASVGHWTREYHHTSLWASRVWSTDNQNGLKVIKIRAEPVQGTIHATVLRLSPWTEEWSLVLVMDELVRPVHTLDG